MFLPLAITTGVILIAGKLFGHAKDLAKNLTIGFHSASYDFKKTKLLTSELTVKLAVGNPLPLSAKIDFISLDVASNGQVVGSVRRDNLQSSDPTTFTIPANSANHILPVNFSINHLSFGTQVFAAISSIFSQSGDLTTKLKAAIPKNYSVKGTMKINGVMIPVEFTNVEAK